MEQTPEGGFMAVELVDRLVEVGIASVKRSYPDGDYRLEGSIEGFELARGMTATYMDFDWTINQRENVANQMKRDMRPNRTDEAVRAYREYRWATIQLEGLRDILLVAEVTSGQRPMPKEGLSARAVGRYSGVVGVADN